MLRDSEPRGGLGACALCGALCLRGCGDGAVRGVGGEVLSSQRSEGPEARPALPAAPRRGWVKP